MSRVYQKIQSGKFSGINYVERKCECGLKNYGIVKNKVVFDVFTEALSIICDHIFVLKMFWKKE